jgi:hypothetical protein
MPSLFVAPLVVGARHPAGILARLARLLVRWPRERQDVSTGRAVALAADIREAAHGARHTWRQRRWCCSPSAIARSRLP